MLAVAQKIPKLKKREVENNKLFYLLGAILTDGSIYLTKRHGEVQFIQKPTKEKKIFIATVCQYMKSIFDKSFSVNSISPFSFG